MSGGSQILESQRYLFDVPDEVAYFNSAYNTPQLKASTANLIDGAKSKARPWERTPEDFFQDAETIRLLGSELFGGKADNYAIVPSASYGMSTAARALEPHVSSMNEIIVLEEAFPSNFLPWQRLSQETGAQIITVPTPRDLDWTRAILGAVSTATQVVAVPHCHWTNGAKIDLQAVSTAVRSVGAVLAIDATQSLGAMPLDLEVVQPDFLVAAGYKWLLCPYGFSLLYVSDRWHTARPMEESWLAREAAENFANLVNYSPNYMPGARRFDVGQKCTATILPGAIAALRQIKSWSIPAISETLRRTNNTIAEHARSIGLETPSDKSRSPHMFGVRLPSKFEGSIVAKLAERKIYVSQRGDALRFAPHVHITSHDIERLLETLSCLLIK